MFKSFYLMFVYEREIATKCMRLTLNARDLSALLQPEKCRIIMVIFTFFVTCAMRLFGDFGYHSNCNFQM